MEPPESPRPGRWRSAYTPYFGPLLEAASDPLTRQITAITASQLGKTATLLSILGHRFCDGPRTPALAVFPTQKLAGSMSADRVGRLIRECRQLDELHAKGKRDGKFEKWIAGVPLRFAWAGSATELAAHPSGLVLIDELDRMGRDVAGEGDPVTLAGARMKNFLAPLLIVTSSPTIEDASPIQALWESGSMEIAEWQCPHCDEWHRPLSMHLRWPDGCMPDVAEREGGYWCPHCGAECEESMRQAMIAGHRFRAYARDSDGDYLPADAPITDFTHRSFWISGLLSPWTTFRTLARLMCAAYRTREPETIQAALNTGFGELWRMRGDAPDWHEVDRHRTSYHMGEWPHGAQVTTMGVDVQRDRLYYVVRAWGAQQGPMESWLLEHGELLGSTDYDDVWLALATIIKRHDLRVRMVLVDSGYRPGLDFYRRPDHAVYSFARRMQPVVFAAKGYDHRDKPVDSNLIDVTLGGVAIKNGLRLYRIDSAYFKSWLYSRVRGDGEGPDLWHLPRDASEDYMRQVVSEELIVKASGQMTWIARRSKPNHYLDCEVLATAAAHALNLYARLTPVPEPKPSSVPPPAAPARRPSRFERRSL